MIASLLVSAAPALAGDRLLDLDAMRAEIPQAESITLERLGLEDAESGLDTLVTVTFSPAALEQLARETGRMDRLQLGAATLRDDGLGFDQHAGDGIFHGVLRFDAARLRAKARLDREAAERGAFEVVHENRVRKSVSAIQAFDLDGFLAGRAVELRPSRHAVLDDAAAEPGRARLKVPGTNAFQESVLAIRTPFVVRDFSRTYDPCTGGGAGMGPWSFGHLMSEIANHPMYPTPPEVMVEQWLMHWTAPQTINTFTAAARPPINNWINDWRAASGGGPLDLSIAPFRLLAILSRVDLRESAGGALGPFSNGGEARFVFGAVVPPTWPSAGSFPGPTTGGGCQMLPFTVIFEYKVPRHSCLDVQAWANDWIHLSTLVPGSVAYNSHLQTLTDSFTQRNAWPSRMLGSALGQLRTNENAFDPLWELREFHTDSALGLVMTETEDNADNVFQNTGPFHDYVAVEYASGVLTQVPSIYRGMPFRTGNPEVPINFALIEPLFYWDEPSLVPGGFIAERHEVSLASCNGCHGGETATPFVHISPTAPLPPARANLSLFMTGFTLNDPAVDQAFADGRYFGPPVPRPFDALEDREVDINGVSAWLCPTPPKSLGAGKKVGVALEDLLRQPVRQVH